MRALPLLSLLLLLPSAAAQGVGPQFGLRAGRHDAPITPLAEVAEIPLAVTVPCALLAPSGGTVRFALASPPPWVQPVFSPAALQLEVCAGAERVANATLRVAVSQDAPGREATNFSVVAWLDHPGGNRSATAPITIEAAYFALIEAQAEPASLSGAPQTTLQYTIRIENLGNAATRVTPSVAHPPGWAVPVPVPVILGSRQSGGTTTGLSLLLTVLTPYETGYSNEGAAITLRLTPAFALDASLQGDPVVLVLYATVKGFYLPAPAALLAALAAALLRHAFGKSRSPARIGTRSQFSWGGKGQE